MLKYFPRMRIAAYVVGCGVPICLALIFWFGFGGSIGVGGVGMVILALLIIMPTLSFNLFNKKADKKIDETLSIYNNQCDPEAFVVASSDIVAKMKEPYEPFEAWYLSFYTLALLDLNRKEEAATIGQAMQRNAQSTQDLEEQLTLLVNILPMVIRLFGPKGGLEVISQAQLIIERNPTPNSVEQGRYLESQRIMIQAVIDHDADYLINRCSQIRTNVSGNQQMRVRVLEAEKEARVREAIGDEAGALECWKFIVENGNKLPCVVEALKHV